MKTRAAAVLAAVVLSVVGFSDVAGAATNDPFGYNTGCVWVMGHYDWNGADAWDPVITAYGNGGCGSFVHTKRIDYGQIVTIQHKTTTSCARAGGWMNGSKTGDAVCP